MINSSHWFLRHLNMGKLLQGCASHNSRFTIIVSTTCPLVIYANKIRWDFTAALKASIDFFPWISCSWKLHSNSAAPNTTGCPRHCWPDQQWCKCLLLLNCCHWSTPSVTHQGHYHFHQSPCLYWPIISKVSKRGYTPGSLALALATWFAESWLECKQSFKQWLLCNIIL